MNTPNIGIDIYLIWRGYTTQYMKYERWNMQECTFQQPTITIYYKNSYLYSPLKILFNIYT